MTALPDAIPDLDALLARVRAEATHLGSRVHGEQHWQAVARNGLWLLEAGVAADPAVLFAFALLHDHRRQDDGADPQHGPRAAANLPAFGDLLALDASQLALLAQACRDHTAVVHDPEPTVGACFDADRLSLARVGTTPDPAFLNHPASREPAMIERCSAAAREPDDWHRLLAAYPD